MSTPRRAISRILPRAFAFAATLLAAAPATAQDVPLPQPNPERLTLGLTDEDKQDLSPDQARALYKQHERQLDRIQGERVEVEETVGATEAERARLNERLLEVARKSADSETRLTALEEEMAELRDEEDAIRQRLRDQHREIGDLLAVMQRMGREPPPVMVTQRDDALRMVRSGMLLNSFLPALKSRADTLAGRLSELTRVLTEKQQRAKELAAEKEELERLRGRTQELVVEKRQRLKQQRARLDALDRAAERHAATISDLGRLLQTLDEEVAASTGLGEYEEQLQSGEIVELKPRAKKAAFVQPGRMKPAVPFAQAKGLLMLPASGSIIRDFGDQDDFGIESQGVSIQTRGEAQVVSPADGWVSYAGEFRSYGQLLIINAGGGYHILLAGMEEIYVRRGQFVLSGEPVASMGEASASESRSGKEARPSLYVEFRKNEKPIDPKPWWASELAKG
jgi:septal ring factor EnvC (AmiA/AmiB activator)